MSSELEKEKQRRLEEEARRLQEEEVRKQVREKYKEAEELVRKASDEGQKIARRAAEEGAKLGEEQVRRAYGEEPVKKEPVRTPTYLQLPSDTRGSQSRDASPGSGLPLTSIATPPPPVYYVIIGCGTAAILNHTTLRQTFEGWKRIGDLPVLHVGGEDPWYYYHGHAMGQPPYLLPLPGYQNQPGSTDLHGRTARYSSKAFAGNNRKEWDRLVKGFSRNDGFQFRNAWVGAIESPTKDAKDLIEKLKQAGLTAIKDMNEKPTTLATLFDVKWPSGWRILGDPHYRLLLVHPDEKVEWVYARYIDICTGAGRMNVRPVPPNIKEYQDASTKYWKPPEKWEGQDSELKQRKVVHGMDGLREETVWKATDRVCVFGGGGIGLNQIERAEDEDCWLDWTARNSVHDAFGLRTNDPVLKSYKPLDNDSGGHVEHYMETGEGDLRQQKVSIKGSGEVVVEQGFRDGMRWLDDRPLYPGNSKWRITKKTALAKVEAAVDKLALSFDLDKAHRVYDFDVEQSYDVKEKAFAFSDQFKRRNSSIVNAKPEVYDRLIICTGQQSDVVGEPAELARRFGLEAIPDTTNDNMSLGLQTRIGDIRILGAAARVFPKFDELSGDKFQALVAYELTLPVSAVVPGFIRTGRSIAAANHFFEERGPFVRFKKLNNNVNTATKTELQEIIEAAAPWLKGPQIRSDCECDYWRPNGS